MRRILCCVLVLFLAFAATSVTRNSIAQDSSLLLKRYLVNHNVFAGGQNLRYLVFWAWDDEKIGSLFVYDTIDKKEHLVSKACYPIDYITNCINDKYYAYLNLEHDKSLELKVLYFDTLTVKKISKGSANRYSLNVSGNYTAWAEYNGSSNPGIYYCKLDEENPEPVKIYNVTIGKLNFISMSTYQEVTKIAFDDPESGDIFLFDTSTKENKKVVSDPNWDSRPFLFRNKLFYTNRNVEKYPEDKVGIEYAGNFKVLNLVTSETSNLLELKEKNSTYMYETVKLYGNPDISDYLYISHNKKTAGNYYPNLTLYSCKPEEQLELEKIEDSFLNGKKVPMELFNQCYDNEKIAYIKMNSDNKLAINTYSQKDKTITKDINTKEPLSTPDKPRIMNIFFSNGKIVFVETELKDKKYNLITLRTLN
jgi:hypothetical protein